MLINKNLNKILLTGILTGAALNSMAADSTTGNNALNVKKQDNPAAKTEPTGDVMTVHAPEVEKKRAHQLQSQPMTCRKMAVTILAPSCVTSR